MAKGRGKRYLNLNGKETTEILFMHRWLLSTPKVLENSGIKLLSLRSYINLQDQKSSCKNEFNLYTPTVKNENKNVIQKKIVTMSRNNLHNCHVCTVGIIVCQRAK